MVNFVIYGQSRLVKGVVFSEEDNFPLPGATILIEGTTNGVVTDLDGNFSIEVQNDAVLLVSYVGFLNKRIPVAGKSEFQILLESDISALEEVVVVGYGEVRKSDLTGSVSSVKAKDIIAFPNLSATQSLQGRAAGLNIQSNNGGEPGADLRVRIRGISSISVGGDPLFVIDGFAGGELPPPEDIASIEVLKDASATAIYGSRATNGVIIVTTKSGVEGGISVNFNSSYSFQQTLNRLDLLDGEQFAQYIREFDENYVFQGFNTDWQDIIFESGYTSNNQVSVSGGNKTAKYYVSGTYFDQEGVVINTGLSRYSLNAKLDVTASERVKLGINMFARRTETDGVQTQSGIGGRGVITSASRFTPDAPILNPDRTFFRSTLGGGNFDNPFALASEFERNRVTDRIQFNNYADVKILDWLSFKTTVGVSVNSWRQGQFTPSTLIQGEALNGVARVDTRRQSNVLSENYFTIQKEWSGHRLNIVNGYSFQKRINEGVSTLNAGFINNESSFRALQLGSNPGIPSSFVTETVLKSYYSRLNYSLKEKYKFTLTGRFDGFSAFAPNNKWGFFPSGAFAWNIIDEPFLSNTKILSNLKFRSSYGFTGNPGAGANSSLAELRPTFSLVPGENAFIVRDLENADLRWEQTEQVNIGIDAGFLDGRVNLSTDIYNKLTKDLLLNRILPGFVGNNSNNDGEVGTQLQNVGRLRNRGIELTVNTKNTVGDFEWSTDFIFALNRNEILQLADDTVVFYGNSPGNFGLPEETQLLQVGQPIGVFYGFVYDGIYQVGDDFIPGSGFEREPGGERFRDLNGDGVLDNNDRTIIGDPNPDFTWSINNSLSYKGFSLNIFIQAVHGQDILNYTLLELERFGGSINTTTTALSRWTPSNPNTDIPKANSQRAFRLSDRFIFDASYVRVKNLTLGYNLPESFLDQFSIDKFRIYIGAQNLFTITNYPGLDPETGFGNTGSGRDGNRNIGLDYASYPNIRSYTVGINLTF